MRTPVLHRLADGFSEVTLVFMVIFSPWAFGTTEPWSIWILNGAGYALGAAWLVRLWVRRRSEYRPARWDRPPVAVWMTAGLGVVTVLLLAQAVLSAWNARVRWEVRGSERYLVYRPTVEWLPQSYDEAGSWMAVASLAALALTFWGARDVLLGKSFLERRVDQDQAGWTGGERAVVIPERARRLLWVICLNAGWLGLVAIFQRLDGTDKLLWVMERQKGYPPEFSFGPYAYKGNAAQFCNLIWPVALGFWWVHRAEGVRHETSDRVRSWGGPHLVLLLSAVILAVCPMISNHTAGAWLVLVALPLVFALFLFSGLHRPWLAGWMLMMGLVLGVGGYLGWRPVEAQLPMPLDGGPGEPASRSRQNEVTWSMARDHPWYGTGPGTYATVYGFYKEPDEPTFPFAHNDWLQTLAEWGWVGLGLAVAGMLLVLLHPVGVPSASGVFSGTVVVSFAVVLLHAVFDFPFQIHSIRFLVCLLAAILVSLPGRAGVEPRGPDREGAD